MPTEENYEVAGVAMSPELYAELKKRADKKESTISEVACNLILEGLESERMNRKKGRVK